MASEGFIAFQSRAEATGMRMLLKNGIFYEFVPFTDDNFTNGEMNPDAETLPIWEVEEGVNYALLMSTCSGAWRYLIGDTIKFTDLDRQEIEITGRTKHYISMVGEHLSVDNMNCALEKISHKLNAEINEFTVMGVPYQGLFAHQWYVGYDGPSIDEHDFKALLDDYLGELNDDYRVERQHALKEVFVTLLPNDVFIEFLKTKGKVGAQHKFPRVMKGTVAEEWLAFVESFKSSVNSTL